MGGRTDDKDRGRGDGTPVSCGCVVAKRTDARWRHGLGVWVHVTRRRERTRAVLTFSLLTRVTTLARERGMTSGWADPPCPRAFVLFAPAFQGVDALNPPSLPLREGSRAEPDGTLSARSALTSIADATTTMAITARYHRKRTTRAATPHETSQCASAPDTHTAPSPESLLGQAEGQP